MFNQHIDRALSEQEIRRRAPSVYAEAPYSEMSQRYVYVPTSQIVAELGKHGWLPVDAQQARVRKAEKRGFQRHLVRFRQADSFSFSKHTQRVGDTFTEIVLVNSHDGGSSYQLHAGLFRLACANGLIVSDATFEKVAIPHAGRSVIDRVIEGTYSVLEAAPRVGASVKEWSAIPLSGPERRLLAETAVDIRWDRDENGKSTAPIQPERLLAPRRYGDNHGDLWTTFNVIQENILRGGVHGRTKSGNRTSTRAVASVSENVKLNKALWTMAEEFAKLKAAA